MRPFFLSFIYGVWVHMRCLLSKLPLQLACSSARHCQICSVPLARQSQSMRCLPSKHGNESCAEVKYVDLPLPSRPSELASTNNNRECNPTSTHSPATYRPSK